METRVKIPKDDLEEIKSQLKNKGYSIRDLNEEINAEFRNYLNKGHSMPKEVFHKLYSMVEFEIESDEFMYANGRGRVAIDLKSKDRELAELIGILLGDGHIHSSEDEDRSGNYVSVTLNEKEEKLLNKTRSHFEKFLRTAHVYDSKNARSKQVRSYGIENVKFVEHHGLQSGNKIVNQVGVPNWIFEKRKYIIALLRGLVDTDGSIYRRTHDNYVVIQFSNRSQKLLKDFGKLCSLINISCSKSGKYNIQIASQDEVIKFLDFVEPIKENRIERPIKT